MAGPVHEFKRRIIVKAPVEVCYQAWTDSTQLAECLHRLLGVEQKSNVLVATTLPEEVHEEILHVEQDLTPPAMIKKWLFSGPGGKLYEVENTVITDIPNHFYCTSSTDPNDLSVQTSIMFSPDSMNQNTLLEIQISYYDSEIKGSMTQLISDVLDKNDNFFEDCLEDFKKCIENPRSR